MRRSLSLSSTIVRATIAMIVVIAIVFIALHQRVSRIEAGTLTLRAVPPVWSDRFVSSVGIATHFSYDDLRPYGKDRATTIRLLIESGARVVRDGLSVSVTGESNDGYWNTMRELTHAGLRLVLVTYPTHLRDGATDSMPFRDQRPLDTAVARVGAENILAFEGPNEVDNNNASWGGKLAYGAQVRAYQNTMYAHAKQIAPSITVLGATTTSASGAHDVGDLSAMMDAGTLHPYPDGEMPAARLASMEGALAPLNAAKKPWWVTETGYHTSPRATKALYQPGVSEIAQGKYVPRLYLDYFAAGIPYTSVYELIDEHVDKSSAESNYGLLYNDGSPKPAYTALKNLLALLADRGAPITPDSLAYSLSGATSTIRQSLFARRSGRYYLVLWNEVPVYAPKSTNRWISRVRRMWERVAGASDAERDLFTPPVPVTLTLAKKAQSIALYVPVRDAKPLSVVDTTATMLVPVPDYPVVLEITP